MRRRKRRGYGRKESYEELKEVKPLPEYSEREELEVVEVRGGRGVRKRLNEIGIIPGKEIEILNKSFGPLVISIMNTRIALGKGLSRKILAKEKRSLEKKVEE